MKSPDRQQRVELERLLAREFSMSGDFTITRLSPDHDVYRIDRDGLAPWAVRVGAGAARTASALFVLDAIGYPAAKLVPSSEGQVLNFLAGSEEFPVVVTTFLEGDPTGTDARALAALGEAVGVLHALGRQAIVAASRPDGATEPIEAAAMLPANELSFALSCLAAVEHTASIAQQHQLDALAHACRTVRDLGRDLTTVFLHGDCHPWNSISRAEGGVQLIDWDSAGPGPAVIDLAFLAISVDTGGLVHPINRSDPSALEALVRGYSRHMRLSDADLDALEAALAFRVLVAAAVETAEAIQTGADPSAGRNWNRLALVPEIAQRIRSLHSTP